jgi:Phage QLRG family, putative DNA packaging.
MKVTVDELKAHLRIEQEEEDAYLGALLEAAHTAAEDFCKTKFCRTLPKPVHLAVLLHAGHFFLNRESSDGDAYQAMMQAFHSLLWPYRNAAKLF